ncbi:MAG: Gmad2 immunoglobulin-like domain-containing protein [Patescibacteria group bacterium]
MPPHTSKPAGAKKKTSSSPVQQTHAPFSIVFMVAIVAMLTVALLLIWRELPIGTKPSPETTPAPPVATAPASEEQTACETAGGKWTECGNPCHGKPDEVCITQCEAQCLCGGADGWQCPKDQVCADYEQADGATEAVGVCRVQPAESPTPTGPVRSLPQGMICDELNFLCVYEAAKDATLSNPFTVDGSGIAFENNISWRLLDANGTVLESGFVTADAPDIGQPGDFQIRGFILSVPTTATGTLEVFESSAKDGQPIHVLGIPVILPRTAMTSRVFLRAVPTETDCSVVNQLEASVPRSGLPVETSLRLLLKMAELRPEQTVIPKGTRLESLTVSGGTANVVLSPELENYGGGSCNVLAIRAQIETTLKQFSSIRNVEISIPGKTPEETLQP